MRFLAPRRVMLLVAGLALLWGVWEGYRWLGIRGHWTVAVRGQRHEHAAHQQDLARLRTTAATRRTTACGTTPLGTAAIFTAKEALAGFALGRCDRLLPRRRALAINGA